MPRDVYDRKKKAALRKLRKAAELAATGLGPPLSEWERQFLEEVEARIETYGSAFADPSKGEDGAALSGLQEVKLKEINKKASGKAKASFGHKQSTFKARRPSPRPAEAEPETPEPQAPPPPQRPGLTIVSGASGAGAGGAKPRPAFRVIEGGAKKTET